jgi:hypothetical protein
MMRLPSGIFRSGGVLDPYGLVSLGGGADTGGALREGVGKVGGVLVLGASSP